MPLAIGRFNTSHVTLYHGYGRMEATTDDVSIHLMLLFILRLSEILHPVLRFNTSHVTLYLL